MAMAKRLENHSMAPKVIVGASMRRLVHLIYGVINSGKVFDIEIPDAVSCICKTVSDPVSPLQRTRTALYGTFHSLIGEPFTRLPGAGQTSFAR